MRGRVCFFAFSAALIIQCAFVRTNAAATMTEQLVAGGAQTLATGQVRNVIISTVDLVPGVSPLPTGTIYIVYEP